MQRANLLVCIALLLTSLPGYSQTSGGRRTPEEAIKLSTELVPLDVQVVAKKTQHTISGLSKNDFEVYEDGVKQQILQFSQDKLPLSVVLLLDASGSMWSVLERLRATAHAALQTLKSEDEVAVVVTANDTRLVQDFTKEKFIVQEALSQLDFKAFGDNGIFLHDSLYRAAVHLQSAANPGDRRVIIAVTDNITIPNHNWRFIQKEQAVSMLLEGGVVVCGLVVKHNIGLRALGKIPSLADRLGGGDLHAYAEITGGEVLSVKDDTVGQRLIELINHLRTRYSLAFAPSNTKRDGKFRRIKVRLVDDAERRIRNSGSGDLAIATRSGYYAKKD
jgi:VWFA-related protein